MQALLHQDKNINRIQILILLSHLLFSAVFLSLAFLDVEKYYSIIDEDRMVEYLSALFWLLAATFILKSLFQQNTTPSNRCLAYSILGVFFIVCCGEEISWGQRIFHFDTPGFIQSINKQDETTLHNIVSTSIFANAFFLFAIVFFWGIPYCLSKNILISDRLRDKLPSYSIFTSFIFSLSLVVWIIIGLRFGTLGFHPYSLWGYYTQADDEIFEFFTAFSFLTFSILEYACQVSYSNKDVIDQ